MARTKEVIVLYTDDGIGNSIGEMVGEVVRCKDCGWYEDGGGVSSDLSFCRWWNTGPTDPEDYCSYAEEKI